MKKIISFTLAILMVFSLFSISFVSWSSAESEGKKITDYSMGDIIEFGWYPQGKVIDTTVLIELNYLAGDNTTWNSYNYYSGTDSEYDGQMAPSDYMRYKDVIYEGNKYRGVYFDDYRPFATFYTSSVDKSLQDELGYYPNTVYWFKYEPIQWRVLDPVTGFVICETIIDSQAYNNYYLAFSTDEYGETAFWGDPEETYYANNYEKSDIRKWLNDDFYNTAFSKQQKNIIQCTELDNRAYISNRSAYDSATTNDKVFLLSYDEAINSNYFSSSTNCHVKGTDYAKCQGLCDSIWLMRTAGDKSNYTLFINFSNIYNLATTIVGGGVRPALKFDLASNIFQSSVKELDHTHSYDDGKVYKYLVSIADFFKKIIAFFKGLFGTLPTINL